jgi:hypothetical protein
VFGEFTLQRVYGTREGQKIEHVPLDQRLQLPSSVVGQFISPPLSRGNPRPIRRGFPQRFHR